MSRRYLGLDLSLFRPGFAVVEVRRRKPPHLIVASHLETNASHNHGHRLAHIKSYLEVLYYDFGPFEAIIREAGFSNQWASATRALFKVAGIADYTFREQTIVDIPPATIKKVLVDNGRASKAEVAAVVSRYFPNQEFATDDETDAVAVVLAYLIQNKLIERMM